MEDRYLFRGKRKDGNGWVQGFLTKPRVGGYTNIMESPDIKGELAEVYEIDETTICQCTGIKDKNGRLIFENDILSGYIDDLYPENETRVRVVWHENGWFTKQDGCGDYDELDDFDSGYFEVCGNIFDNPEMLDWGNEEVKDMENLEVRR